MTRDTRAIVALHAAFFVCAAPVLVLEPPAKGWAILALVVAYNVALPLTARAVDRDDWFAMWALLLPISIFQIVPDWILADLVGTLSFPDTGGPRVDDVIPLAMGGMWVLPLFVVLALSGARPGRAAALAAAVFLGTELAAPLVGLWEPAGDPAELAGVALYVLPAEAALGWATATAYNAERQIDVARTTSIGRSAVRVGLGAAVATFYTGALVVSYFLVDVAGWSISA